MPRSRTTAASAAPGPTHRAGAHRASRTVGRSSSCWRSSATTAAARSVHAGIALFGARHGMRAASRPRSAMIASLSLASGCVLRALRHQTAARGTRPRRDRLRPHDRRVRRSPRRSPRPAGPTSARIAFACFLVTLDAPRRASAPATLAEQDLVRRHARPRAPAPWSRRSSRRRRRAPPSRRCST